MNKVEKVNQLELENPVLYDELANRKKQTYIQKNSSRAIKDSDMNNAYWNLLNHMPQKMVKNVVTPRVLDMDRRSCDHLLKSIYE